MHANGFLPRGCRQDRIFVNISSSFFSVAAPYKQNVKSLVFT
jgi:hypothetical protein